MFTGGLFALKGASHLISSHFFFLCVFLFSILSYFLFVLFVFSLGPSFLSWAALLPTAFTRSAEKKTDRAFMTTFRVATLRVPHTSRPNSVPPVGPFPFFASELVGPASGLARTSRTQWSPSRWSGLADVGRTGLPLAPSEHRVMATLVSFVDFRPNATGPSHHF